MDAALLLLVLVPAMTFAAWRRRRSPSASPTRRASAARDAFRTWAQRTGRPVRSLAGGLVALGARSSAQLVGDPRRPRVRVIAVGRRHQQTIAFRRAANTLELDAATRAVEARADRDLGWVRSYR